jgi:hypothetical protein
MPAALWAAFGMTIGTAVLYVALGLPRPFDRTHLSFAGIMVTLVAYAFFEAEIDRATSPGEVVEIVRWHAAAAHLLIAALLVFVSSYTRVRIPRWLVVVYGVGLAVVFIANLVAPYGIWYSAQPRLISASFGGASYTNVVPPRPAFLQYFHTVFVVGVFALTFTCALKQIRRGERRRGFVLAISLAIVMLQHLVDVIREAVGGTWPYSDEFGFVTWSVIMSVQLAIDYRMSAQRLRATLDAARKHAAELARTADAALRLRDKLNTPLQTLELTLSVREPRTPEEEEMLFELRDAVTRISELSHSVERTTESPSSLAALERAS